MRLVIILGSVMFIIIGAIGGGLFWAATVPLPDIKNEPRSMLTNATGEVIASVTGAVHRPFSPLQDISPHLIQATIAIEDRRFYRHQGFDWRAVARATSVNLRTRKKAQGASTISQQLARNLFLSHEKTWRRKGQEALYTLRLERQWSKEKILTSYLNRIYYGHSAYGADEAARVYFAKSASQLSLAESAMLAGIPKGPKYYSPLLRPEQAKVRQRQVLAAMVDGGFITRAQAIEAGAQPLKFRNGKQRQRTIAPYFVDYVRQRELDETGLDARRIAASQLRIETTIDLDMQAIAERTVSEHLRKYHELQVALVALDPRTGEIKAMVGGKDYRTNQFNRVLSATRQPGSAFKPVVYLTAILTGKTALSKHRSEPAVFVFDNGKQTYTPKNFGNQYADDWVDMRYAIAHSDNIYAVKTLQQSGAEKVIALSRKLGINAAMKPLPSLALGAFPVSPLEMASAYAVIANGGVYHRPTAIRKVVDHRSSLLYEHRDRGKRIIPDEHAFVLTKMMEDVFARGGTAYRVAHLIKRPVAGKTGTTNVDAWMVGFTPELVTAVWVGHDQQRAISAAEAQLAAPIFATFTERSLQHVPPKMFTVPQNVVSLYIDPKSGKVATDACPVQRLEYFVAGTEPTQYCESNGAPVNRGAAQQKQPPPTDPEINRSWLKKLSDWWSD